MEHQELCLIIMLIITKPNQGKKPHNEWEYKNIILQIYQRYNKKL